MDFGDAPYPFLTESTEPTVEQVGSTQWTVFYATTVGRDGAAHCARGPTLGPTRDVEARGQPSLSADGDGDDDDGVRMNAIRVGQVDAEVIVDVENFDPAAGARLDAWIDFNGDGSWGGAWEQIADNRSLPAGESTLQFDVPSWASSGSTYARFRISSAGDLGHGGLALDGEVEDYVVNILPPVETPRVFAEHPTLKPIPDVAWIALSTDLDGDGDEDVVTKLTDDSIRWYENRLNEGISSFQGQPIVSFEVRDASAIVAADLDGDGDQDLLAASWIDDRVVWFENRLNQSRNDFGPLQVISESATEVRSIRVADLDGDGEQDVLSGLEGDARSIVWHENRLDQPESDFAPLRVVAADGHSSVTDVADVDGDGDPDLLSVSNELASVVWYENRIDEPTFDFAPLELVSDELAPTDGVLADWDGDGDLDAVVSGEAGNAVVWFENRRSEGQAGFGPLRPVSDHDDGAGRVLAVDLDGDADLDVVMFADAPLDNSMYWIENRLNEDEAGFSAEQLLARADRIGSAVAGDMDLDGDADILSTLPWEEGIVWFENTLNQSPGEFPAHDVHCCIVSFDYADHGFTVDVDGDGDLDVVSIRHRAGGAQEITWYENRLNEPQGDFGRRHVIDTGLARTAQVVDFDGDGDPDVLAVWWADGEHQPRAGVVWYENRLDQESADFGPPTVLSDDATTNVMQTLVAADVDGDGDYDLITGEYDGGSGYDNASFRENRLNQPEGDFAPPRVLLNRGSYSISAVDIDRDGDIDVMQAGSYPRGGLWWHETYPGDEGTLFGQTLITESRQSLSATMADLDKDGDQDLLALDSWYENLFDGDEVTFAAGRSFLSASRAIVAPADMDGDGDFDVLSVLGDHVAVSANRLNEVENDFGVEELLGTTVGSRSTMAADVDNDGDLDVVNVEGDSVTWYENLNSPTVLTIERFQPGEATTGATTVVFRVTFSAPVSDVSVEDFTLVDLGDTLSRETIVEVTAIDDATYDVTVATGTGDGELRLDLLASSATVFDAHDLSVESNFTEGEIYRIDRSGPLVQVVINGDEVDPPDLLEGPQPSVWTSQRSSIRSLSLEFSEPVDLDLSSLSLVNLGVEADVDPDVPVLLAERHLTASFGGDEWTIRFDAGELPDGVYRLEIASTVLDAAGNALDGDGDGLGGDAFVLAGDATNRFFVLRGDWDGDAAVSIFDTPALVYWYGQSTPVHPEYVDLNGDGGVSIFDYSVYVRNYRREIRYPTAFGDRPTAGTIGGQLAASDASRHRIERERHEADASARDVALSRILAEWTRDHPRTDQDAVRPRAERRSEVDPAVAKAATEEDPHQNTRKPHHAPTT